MKKFWGILSVLLVCNIVSLFALADGEHKYSDQERHYRILQQFNSSTLDTPSDFAFSEQPTNVAIVANQISVTESNSAAKTSTSSSSKLHPYTYRKYTGISHLMVVIYNNTTICFTRAIDCYVYALRHIII